MSTTIQPGGGKQGQQAFGSAIGSANALSGQGSTLFGQGQGQLAQSGKYFSTLAGGNRAATAQALAPDVENINSVYGGTARTLSRFLRGPEKDVQLAETERERAGQVGSLFRNARPQANAALTQMGQSAVGTGVGATGGAGGLFSSAAGQGQQAAIASSQLSQQAGAGFGGLLFNILKGFVPGGGLFKGGGGTSLSQVGTVAGP